MRTLQQLAFFCSVIFIAIAPPALAQKAPATSPRVSNPHARENAEQVAKILGISQLVSGARLIHTQSTRGTIPTVEELSMSQEIFEPVMAASLEVDGVLAELNNERAHLSELSATLQASRDRAANLTNVANLITEPGQSLRT